MAAVRAYIHAGYAMDASRLLANLGRYGDAGDLLLKALRLSPDQVGTLTGARRSAALKAAVCYARADRITDAATVVLALGARESVVGTLLEVDDQKAAENLLRNTARPGEPDLTLKDAARIRAGELLGAEQHADALRLFALADAPSEMARVLWAQGSQREAIALLIDKKLWLEAARCQQEAQDIAGAMASLSRIQPSNIHFRQACCSLIQIVHDHNLDSRPLDERLETWNRGAPQNLAEIEALSIWARLLEARGDLSRAAEILVRVEERRPGHSGVSQRLQSLREQLGIAEPSAPPPAAPRPAATRPPTSPQAANRARRDVRGPSVQFQMPGMPQQPVLPEQLPGTPSKRPMTREGLASTAFGGSDDLLEKVAAENTPEAIKPGMVINGRYEILEHLGDGATASVFKAHDIDLGDDIAMKVFHLMISRNETMAERMKLEIKACRKLSHRNIIKVFDIGNFAGHRYLTMEFLSGQTLQDVIREPIPQDQAMDMIIQACRGLHEAHRNDFVHRDVKPDNLFLTTSGVVKVMDFGIAKQTNTEGMTLTGTILGTPGYMAPEQIDGSTKVSHAADQYAIGSMAYRMFTGTMVFQHDEMMPLLMMHVTETPELPSKRTPGIRPELDTFIMRLLSKKPGDRFPSCGAVADALEVLRKTT